MDRLITADASRVSPAEFVRHSRNVFAGKPPSAEYLAAVARIAAVFNPQPMSRQDAVEKLTGWAKAEDAALRPRRAA